MNGHVYRQGKAVIEVVSAFLYRGRFVDYYNTFETTEEPDYMVDLSDDAAVGVLQSKDWFEWDNEAKPKDYLLLEVGDDDDSGNDSRGTEVPSEQACRTARTMAHEVGVQDACEGLRSEDLGEYIV